MALKAVLDKIDDLPEELQAHYKAGEDELEGKFILDVTPWESFALEDISGLKTSLETTRDENKTLKKTVKAFEGMDPKEVKKALKTVKDLEGKPDVDQQVETLMQSRTSDLVSSHEKILSEKDEEIGSLLKELEGHLIDAVGMKAIESHEGSTELLMPLVRSSTKMRKNSDGQFVAEVVSPDGVARVDSKGKPMTLDQLVSEMKGKDAFARAFNGTNATGGGSTGDNEGTGVTEGGGTSQTKVVPRGKLITGVDPADVVAGKVNLQPSS